MYRNKQVKVAEYRFVSPAKNFFRLIREASCGGGIGSLTFLQEFPLKSGAE